jgi:hypothetical protein
MQTALVIILLLAILAGAVFVGHYGWVSAGDVAMPAWGWLMMGLGIFFTLLVGGGLMALVFYSSRAGFDEPPEVVQEKKHRAAKWAKMIPRRKNGARPSYSATKVGPAHALECPLWVISGHTDKSAPCPLYTRWRTFVSAGGMSEKCPKRKFIATRGHPSLRHRK